jgi:hypothetical protein
VSRFQSFTINSAAELLAHAKRETLLPNHFYRGHSKASYKLVPSLFRFEIEASGFVDWNHVEISLECEFEAKHLAYIGDRSLERLDRICLGRHHGLPVRIMDWSRSAMVALFFAVECEDNGQQDSVVWELQPPIVMQGAPSTNEKLKDTQIFSARHTNLRVAAQSGCFSWHELPESRSNFVPLDERVDAGVALRRFIVPGAARAAVKQELHAMRINYETLFPDLDGLCRQLGWMLEEQKRFPRRFRSEPKPLPHSET